MRVFSINYQPICKGMCGNALIHYIFKTFRQLDDEYIFVTSSVDDFYGLNIIGHSHFVAKLLRLFVVVASRLHVPYYYIRSWCEIIVDYQHYIYLKKQKAPYVLITSMYSRRCTKLAKKVGCRTILIAGNLNDDLYYDTVTKEQQRLGLKYTDVYSSKYRISIYRDMMSNIDEIWVNTNFAAKTFSNKKTEVIPINYYESRGYSPKVFENNNKSELVIGYFGHTTLLKGVHLLAEAVSKCKYKDTIKLVLVGKIDGNVSKLLKEIDANIQYMGVVPESDKEELIKTFDLMAVPSLYDAGPTTIYEGCECNVPLLVSDGCGGSELIQNNKGCLIFKTMDFRDLISKIENFYENRSQYESYGSRADFVLDVEKDQRNIDILKSRIKSV